MADSSISKVSSGVIVAGAVLYSLGVGVTAIHLSRLGIRDLSVAKVAYIFSGAVCAGFLLLSTGIAIALAEWRALNKICSDALEKAISHFADVPRPTSRVAVFVNVVRAVLEFQFRQGAAVFFGIFMAYLSIPTIGVLARVLDVRDINVELRWLGMPIFPVVWLLVYEGFMVVVYLLRKLYWKVAPLRYLWYLLVGMVLLGDVAFYAALVHPLVRPIFGGGRASMITVFPKDRTQAIWSGASLAESSGGFRVYLLHEVGDAIYVTPMYRLNYSASGQSRILDHGPVLRIAKESIVGFVLGDSTAVGVRPRDNVRLDTEGWRGGVAPISETGRAACVEGENGRGESIKSSLAGYEPEGWYGNESVGQKQTKDSGAF